MFIKVAFYKLHKEEHMRAYHIYRQVAQIKDAHGYSAIYKWMPHEYIGFVYGTKNLKNYFDSMGRFARRSFSTRFLTGTFKRSLPTYYSFFDCDNDAEYNLTTYIIIDDKGNFRDYNELVQKYKKRYCCGHNGAYQYRVRGNIMRDHRRSVTPEEINEMEEEYGITLSPIKPKRNINPWDLSECVKCSKGWKAQSKRKRQYKEVMI